MVKYKNWTSFHERVRDKINRLIKHKKRVRNKLRAKRYAKYGRY
ncbi:hypothetical protein [Clostridium sp.]|nr:hypothetical protein [Clostridium sp.]MDU2106350.1 hypothetical protein [Clostridium sp.]MDU3352776.1 hypothetical protein [Clostridium sp.]